MKNDKAKPMKKRTENKMRDDSVYTFAKSPKPVTSPEQAAKVKA